MRLIQLFWSFFQIGLFSIGGGYAALPLIQEQVVEKYSWLSMMEFTDLITIAEMTPGPIAINAATFVGLRIEGVWGAVTATFGCVFPSCIIMSILAYLYFKYSNLKMIQGILAGLRPAVVALIASAGVSILLVAFFGEKGSIHLEHLNLVSVLLFAAAFFILKKWKPSPVLVMFSCGIGGGAVYLLTGF